MPNQENVLQGKFALVTGGSRGIGLAATQQLVNDGARVAILGRNQASLDEARSNIGEQVLTIAADVGDPDSVRNAFAKVEQAFGALDILVNNAGVGMLGKVEHLSDEAIRQQLDTNVAGLVYCCRQAIPLLRASENATIIILSSDSVPDPFPYLSLYAGSKGAVEVLSKALCRELKPDGIRVTLLRAGPTLTSFAEAWDSNLSDEAFEVWQREGYLKLGQEGGGMPLEPLTVAQAISYISRQPKGTYIDFLEVRPV